MKIQRKIILGLATMALVIVCAYLVFLVIKGNRDVLLVRLSQENLDTAHRNELLYSFTAITEITALGYLVFSLLLVVLTAVTLYFWLNKPLRQLTESLALESSNPIRKLTSKQDEFGQIAVMIERFFEQKKELADIIHEKNDALLSLSDAEAKNRAILQAIPDILFRINLFGIITDFHAGNIKDLPVSSAQVLGKNLEEILPPSVSTLAKNAINEVNKTKTPQTFEFPLSFPDYPKLFFEATLTITTMGDYLAVVRDITARKEAAMTLNRTLEREIDLNRLKTQFITTVSHEFRTPLSAISSNIQLLEMYGAKWAAAKKEEVYQRLQQAIQEMISMLDDLFYVAKDQSGKLAINPTYFELSPFCRELINTPALQPQGNRIRFEYTSSKVGVKMDKDLLRHIFVNLLGNALKFTSGTGEILFRVTDHDEKTVAFKVQDRGIGIPDRDLEKIFEPFLRAENAAPFPGSGLGLYIVKRCVDLHLGSVSITSEHGNGTTAHVLLPDFTFPPLNNGTYAGNGFNKM